MQFTTIQLVEWAGMFAAVLWAIGLAGLAAGSRRARRAFRGKGYLRPPSGKAWVRFLYYKHYDAFEDSGIRFFYGLAHLCLTLFVILALALGIFLGSEFLLRSVSAVPSPVE